MSFTQKIIKEKSDRESSKNEIVDDICSFDFKKSIVSFIDSLTNNRYDSISLTYKNIEYKRNSIIKETNIERYKFQIIDILKDYICLPQRFDKDSKIEVNVKPQYKKKDGSIERIGIVFYVDVLYFSYRSENIFFISSLDKRLANSVWKRRLAIRCLDKGIFVEISKDGRKDPSIITNLNDKWNYLESRLY